MSSMICDHCFCLSATFKAPEGQCRRAYKCCKCLVGDANYHIFLATEKVVGTLT